MCKSRSWVRSVCSNIAHQHRKQSHMTKSCGLATASGGWAPGLLSSLMAEVQKCSLAWFSSSAAQVKAHYLALAVGRASSQLTHGNLVNRANLMNLMLSPNLQTKLRWEDGFGHVSQSMWTREHGDNWQVPGDMWQWEGNLLPQNKCPELSCLLLLKLSPFLAPLV